MVIDKVYILKCIGDEKFFNGHFNVICKTAFKEDPLKTDKYNKEIEAFLKECKNEEKYLSCVEEGTEQLISFELQLI